LESDACETQDRLKVDATPVERVVVHHIQGRLCPGPRPEKWCIKTFTDDVLFGDAWKRPQLSPRDRSLITVAALTAGGNGEQLTFHLRYAKDNGATEEELIEAITHLAFYAGWPKAFSAMAVAKQVFRNG
jgi:4-carboxymuconolactone decarboxylase